MLKLVPALTLMLVLGPILAGLAGLAVAADGAAWRALVEAPGLGRAILLALWTGTAATLLSLGLVVAIGAAFHDSRAFRLLRRLLGPLLAVPHAALAIGLAVGTGAATGRPPSPAVESSPRKPGPRPGRIPRDGRWGPRRAPVPLPTETSP